MVELKSKSFNSGPSKLIISNEFRDLLLRSFVLTLPNALKPLSQSAECIGTTDRAQAIFPKYAYKEQ